jgi:hypothetical protein
MDFGFYQSVLTNQCECGVFFIKYTKYPGYCWCDLGLDKIYLECHKDDCTLDETYLNEVQKNFDPAKKDDVIASLISHYGWGNGDDLIKNLTTTLVNLLVQYPGCVRLPNGQLSGSCSTNQYRTILSFSNGIMGYRCNVAKPSEVLPSETPLIKTPPSENPPSENPPSENPPGKSLTMK